MTNGFLGIADKAHSSQAITVVKPSEKSQDNGKDEPMRTECVEDTHAMRTDYTPNAQNTSSETQFSKDVSTPASSGKARVNVSMTKDVHQAMKRVASRYGTSVSALCLEGWLAIKARYGE